jgi:hypothetical protein
MATSDNILTRFRNDAMGDRPYLRQARLSRSLPRRDQELPSGKVAK